MEKTIIIHGKVDTGSSVEDLEKVEQAIDDVTDSSKELSQVEKNFQELNDKIKAGGMSIAQLKKSIKEYQNIAIQAGEDSPVGQQAIQNAAALRDRIGDLNTAINNTAHDGKNMQAALQLGSTVVSGYTAFQGVTAMLGVENEKLLETLTKLQAATSTLQAVEQIRAALEKESFLMIKAKAVATNVMTAAQWALNVAMNANPISLIIGGFVALGLGIAALVSKFKIFTVAWDGIKMAINGVIKAIGIAYDWTIKTAEAILDFVNNSKAMRIALGILTLGFSELYLAAANYVKSLKDQSEAERRLSEQREANRVALQKASTERIAQLKNELKALDDLNKKQKETTDRAIRGIDMEIERRQAAGQDFADIEAKKLKMVIERAKQELEIELQKNERLKQYLEDQARLYGVTQDAILSQLKKSGVDVDNIRKGREKAEQDARDKLEEAEQALTVFQISEGKKRSDKAKEQGDKNLEMQRALEDLMVANIKDSTERQIAEITLRHSREREEMIKKYGQNTQLMAELEKKQATELSDLKDKLAKEAADKEKEKINREATAAAELRVLKAKENFEIEIEAQKELAALKRDQALQDDNLTASQRLLVEEQYADQVKTLDKELSDFRVAQKQMERDALINVGTSLVNGLRSIGEIAIKDGQKSAKFNAWLTTAQMALDTAKAITSVIAGATAAAAAGGPAAPFLLAGYIASGIATVLANVATAVKAFRSANVGNAPSVPGQSSGSSSSNQSGFITRGQTEGQSTEPFTNPKPQEVVILQSELERNNRESTYLKTRSTI